MYGINAYYRTFELYIFYRKECNKIKSGPVHMQVENIRKNTLNPVRKQAFQGLSMPQSVRASVKIRVQLLPIRIW